jgi:hypothetical protein
MGCWLDSGKEGVGTAQSWPNLLKVRMGSPKKLLVFSNTVARGKGLPQKHFQELSNQTSASDPEG